MKKKRNLTKMVAEMAKKYINTMINIVFYLKNALSLLMEMDVRRLVSC